MKVSVLMKNPEISFQLFEALLKSCNEAEGSLIIHRLPAAGEDRDLQGFLTGLRSASPFESEYHIFDQDQEMTVHCPHHSIDTIISRQRRVD